MEWKLDGELDGLPDALYSSFDWTLAGNRVGACWRSQLTGSPCYLGGPSPVNNEDCPLCLWIGVSNNDELLVLITHSVKTGARAKAPRRMFMILPAESIKLGTSSQGFGPLTLDQVPPCLFERPNDPQSACSNGFLHIGITLQREQRSTVIMPLQPFKGRLGSTSLSLLDGLKSLSEASDFDLYFKFNSYAQIKLRSLQKTLDAHPSRYKTPMFNMREMYRGKRDGGFDLWQEQGWHEPELQTSPKRKRRASSSTSGTSRHGVRPSAIDAPPPPYDDSNTAARAQTPNHASNHNSNHIPNHTPNHTTVVLVPQSCTPDDRAYSQDCGSSRVCETPCTAVSTTAVAANASAACLFAPEPRDSSTLSTRFLDEVPQWLLSAWTICPFAHYRSVVHLLDLSLSARAENLQGYERARALCTFRLVSHKAKHNRDHQDTTTLASEARNLITWMLIVDPSSDLHSDMWHRLIEYQKQVKLAIDNEHCYDVLMNMKASIVTDVYFRHRRRRSDYSMIIDRIREQMDALSPA